MKVVKHIFSGLLAFVILLTSTGFTVSTHSCMGEVVKTSVSFVDTDVSCGMKNDVSINQIECDTENKLKSNCCHNEFHIVQMEDESTLKSSLKTFDYRFAAAFITLYINQFQLESTRTDIFQDRSPPPLIRDISLAVQSFLI